MWEGLQLELRVKKHKRIHSREKYYGCPQCGKVLSSQVELLRHTRIHTGEKPYKCKECGKAFSYDRSVITKCRAHERDTLGRSPVDVRIVGRLSKISTALPSLKEPTLERNPINVQCGRAFNGKSNLTSHQRIRSEERP